MVGRSGAPTLEDVAVRAGVSRALVSLVMRNSPKVSQMRREAVLAAAEELGYRPHAAARSLAQRRSDTVGVVVNDLHNTFFADVADGLHEHASAHGFRLLLSAVWGRHDDERDAIDALLEHRADAIVLIGPRVDESVVAAAAAAVPVVVVARRLGLDDVDFVANDDVRGAELAVDHLVELGHTDIVHVDGGTGAGARYRRVGFEQRMVGHGLEPRVVPGNYDEASGASAAGHLIDSDALPTAIVCGNDLSAVGALDRLERHGLRLPDDISLVGYDNTSIAALRHVSLTTIHQPRREMGVRGMEMVLERLRRQRSEPAQEVIEPQLVARTTSGPVPKEAP